MKENELFYDIVRLAMMLEKRQEDKLVLSLIIKVKLSQYPASDED